MVAKYEKARGLLAIRDKDHSDGMLIVLAVLLGKNTSNPEVGRKYVLDKLHQMAGMLLYENVLDAGGIEILLDILEGQVFDPIAEVKRRFGYDRR